MQTDPTPLVDISCIAPFSFQVSGHGALLRFGNKVCKPMIDRELRFYQKLSSTSDLLPFLPRFYGIVGIRFGEDKVKELLKFYSEKENEENKEDKINPWGIRMNKLQYKTYLSTPDRVFPYIILSDLTAGYRKPCICDIKVGTRQHGDDTPPEKAVRHMKKCSTTTSSSLGLRICGLQVYSKETNSFSYLSKYEGRKLTPQGVKMTLASFFPPGGHFRDDLLSVCISHLNRLLKAVEKEHCFRFYSTSLLIIYEGDDGPDDSSTAASSRCSCENCNSPKPSNISSSSTSSFPSFSPASSSYCSSPIVGCSSFCDCTEDNCCHHTPHVQLKMIDFAHTFPLLPTDVQDDGYTFGISCLSRLLTEIQEERKSRL